MSYTVKYAGEEWDSTYGFSLKRQSGANRYEIPKPSKDGRIRVPGVKDPIRFKAERNNKNIHIQGIINGASNSAAMTNVSNLYSTIDSFYGCTTLETLVFGNDTSIEFQAVPISFNVKPWPSNKGYSRTKNFLVSIIFDVNNTIGGM